MITEDPVWADLLAHPRQDTGDAPWLVNPFTVTRNVIDLFGVIVSGRLSPVTGAEAPLLSLGRVAATESTPPIPPPHPETVCLTAASYGPYWQICQRVTGPLLGVKFAMATLKLAR